MLESQGRGEDRGSKPRGSADVAVVVATHGRAKRLHALLEGLRNQTLARSRFEVIVVDDASTDSTGEVLEQAEALGEIDLHVIRRHESAGPATARQDGWRKSSAPLIAFTDDDCVPTPGWLEHGLRAVAANPDSIIQGATSPAPAELYLDGPFSRTVSIESLDPAFQTCNIFYPRRLLETIGGFDTAGFGRAPGGEDSDLGWRAIKAGASAVFAPEAQVHHAVEDVGPLGMLRYAARWTTPMLAYARHSELRQAHFVKGIFWKGSHYLLMRAMVGLVLPRRLRWLRAWFLGPYLLELRDRLREKNASPVLVPYFLVHDLVELAVVTRGAVRYRRLMI